MKILIINDYFPPSNSMGIRRIASWVKYWSQSGIDIHIGSTQKDLSLLPEFVSEFVHLHPLGNVVDNNVSDNKSKKVSKFIPLLRILKNTVFGNLLEFRFAIVPVLTKHLNKVILDEKITHIISSNPSFASHLVACKLKKKYSKLIWVADYRDLFSGNPTFPGCFPFTIIEQRIEKKTLSLANRIVTINNVLSKHLAQVTNHDVAIVENGIELDDMELRKGFDIAEKNIAKHQSPVNIIYTGAVLRGLYDIKPIIEAINLLIKKFNVDSSMLRFKFYGQQDGLDKRQIEKENLTDYFELHGSVDRSLSLRLQSSADALLFLGAQPNGGKGVDGVVSGKVFEYITAGTPIIGVGVRPSMVVHGILVDSETSICLSSDSIVLADSLFDLICRKRDGNPHRLKCNKYLLAKYDRVVLAQKMLDIVKTAC